MNDNEREITIRMSMLPDLRFTTSFFNKSKEKQFEQVIEYVERIFGFYIDRMSFQDYSHLSEKEDLYFIELKHPMINRSNLQIYWKR